LTGQKGVHARFESSLFERFQQRLTINPAPPSPMERARDSAFDALMESYQLVEPLLDADKEAKAGRSAYDDEDFEKFFLKAKSVLERSLGASITATASLIIGAWEQAGRPALKIEMPRSVQPARIQSPHAGHSSGSFESFE